MQILLCTWWCFSFAAFVSKYVNLQRCPKSCLLLHDENTWWLCWKQQLKEWLKTGDAFQKDDFRPAFRFGSAVQTVKSNYEVFAWIQDSVSWLPFSSTLLFIPCSKTLCRPAWALWQKLKTFSFQLYCNNIFHKIHVFCRQLNIMKLSYLWSYLLVA